MTPYIIDHKNIAITLVKNKILKYYNETKMIKNGWIRGVSFIDYRKNYNVISFDYYNDKRKKEIFDLIKNNTFFDEIIMYKYCDKKSEVVYI